MPNIDDKTVASFGDEWSRFDQSGMSESEQLKVFDEYFSVFPWESLAPDAEGFDMGCGSGRWARWVAPRVGTLHCVDPSSAIDIARKQLSGHSNVQFHSASLDDDLFNRESQDFGYSLGVLHHIPDTAAAIRTCAAFLKPGAPLLLYLYYAFDNRPRWFRTLWKISEMFRRIICSLPVTAKNVSTDIIAALVYWPLAKTSLVIERWGLNVSHFPLSFYRNHSFYTMRTDSRDRFGTPLEQRFTRAEITRMMENAGLTDIRFSEKQPFWCVVGYKK